VGEAASELAVRMAAAVGSVGVIAPAAAADEVAGALAAAGVPLQDDLSAGINLLSLADVKGLEFDAAVVVEPAAILAERPDGGRGGLYTALTRSTRALAVVHAQPLPAELAAADDLHVIRDPTGWAAHRRG
jgi:hypothetical protein